MKIVSRLPRWLVAGATVAFLVLGMGCASYPETHGVPDAQLANIVAEYHGSMWLVYHGIRISAVDGKQLSDCSGLPPTSTRVAPGLRKITVFYTATGAAAGEGTITIPVESKHTYDVKFETIPDPVFHTRKVRYWIVDRDTGKVFSDTVYGSF
jgi:hypothetical protein